MSEQDREVTEAIGSAMASGYKALGQLRADSTTLRCSLEESLAPLLAWVADARQYIGRRPRSDEKARELWERIANLDNDDEDYIDYDVELEMDKYTGNALQPVIYALENLSHVLDEDPLVQSASKPEAQPVMDLLRTLAESVNR